jgi:hypothetical protein
VETQNLPVINSTRDDILLGLLIIENRKRRKSKRKVQESTWAPLRINTLFLLFWEISMLKP